MLALILFSAILSQLHAADIILTNGKIYTVNAAQPWAEAMVVLDGVIEYVGTSEQARNYLNAETELVDLEGKLVLPGFHDVHMHPLVSYASFQRVCDIRGGHTLKLHLKRLKDCAAEQKHENWFLGWGHWAGDIIDSKTMPKLLLDEQVTDKPAVIFALTSHSNWVNSAALRKIGWDSSTPNPPGGVIVKNKKTGEPTGILFDTAADIINDLIYLPTDQALEAAYYGLDEVMREISRNGITSIAAARVLWKRKHLDVWSKAEQDGILRARTVLDLWVYPQDDDSQIETLKSFYRNDEGSLLRVTGIKTYADGLIGNTTAAMKQPYDIDYGMLQDNLGLNYLDEIRLTKFVTELERQGFNFMIHALGDRAVHESLNAVESAIKINGDDIDRRHRITHVDLIDNVDLPRFKELGVIADFQLAADWTHPREYKNDAFIYIKDRVKYAYRIKDVFDSGATLTLSSDFDVSTMNPLVGIQNSITREEQSLPSLDEAIRAYTLNGAYALHQDDITGSLEVGKYADLIVLDKNIFELPENQITSARVLLTLLAGKKMYAHSSWR